LTSSFSHAFGFTYNAGGELGEWAYRQCEGFRDFEIELDLTGKPLAISKKCADAQKMEVNDWT